MNKIIQGDKTIILISDQMSFVKQFCDEVIWLDGGKIKKQGSTKKIVGEYLKKNGGKSNDE